MNELQSPEKTVSVCRNGIPIATGYLQSGMTYAPIRKVAEALGYTVRWNEVDHVVDLTGLPKNTI